MPGLLHPNICIQRQAFKNENGSNTSHRHASINVTGLSGEKKKKLKENPKAAQEKTRPEAGLGMWAPSPFAVTHSAQFLVFVELAQRKFLIVD